MSRFSLLFQLAIRNARRNPRRTFLTAATVLIGTGLTTFVLTFLNGYMGDTLEAMANNHGHVRVVTEAFAEREILQPLYENIADVEPLRAAIAADPHVTQVEPVIRTGVVLATGEEIGEDFGLLVGAGPGLFEKQLHLNDYVIAGTWFTGTEEEVVIGRKLANDIGAQVGQEILVLGQTQYGSMSPMSPKVVGIVAHDGMTDARLYMNLESARWLVDIPEGSIELMVFADDHDPAVVGPLVDRLRALPALAGYNLRGWHQEPFAAQAFPILEGINIIIAGLMMFVMVLAIFNTMTMSVLERTGEIGVMRAMGQTRVGAVLLFLLESVVIGAIGGVAGVGVGALGGLYFQVNGVSIGQDMIDEAGANFPITATIYAQVSAEVLLQCLLLGLVTAAVGALWPSLRAASIEPCSAMRARR